MAWCWCLWTDDQGLKREPGVNPGLPRSGKRERSSSQALVLTDWEAVSGRKPATPERS